MAWPGQTPLSVWARSSPGDELLDWIIQNYPRSSKTQLAFGEELVATGLGYIYFGKSLENSTNCHWITKYCRISDGSYIYISGWWLKNPSWKIWVKVNRKDDIPYMKWTIKNVWNHQSHYHWITITIHEIPLNHHFFPTLESFKTRCPNRPRHVISFSISS